MRKLNFTLESDIQLKEMNAHAIHVRKRSSCKKKKMVEQQDELESKRRDKGETESAWKIEEEGFDDLL